MCERVFFHKLAGWYLATLLPVNFFTDSFSEFWLIEHLLMANSRSYTKCLKSTSEIVIVYNDWNPAICTLNK